MELDGYNEELALAFEYQGEYHYKYISYFHQKIRDFKKRKEDDKLKRVLCEKRGIILIEVPYSIKYEQMQEFILNQCSKKNVNIPSITERIDYKKLNIYPSNYLEKMRTIAKERGGRCLSDEYINDRIKLLWECKEGHIWKATASHIKNGKWCPKCAVKKRSLNRRLTIYEMQEIAKQREGECLSSHYINNRTKLVWKCKKGHIWKATPSHIKGGRWCPKCAHKKKLTIEEMREVAKQRGGSCLSSNYINNSIKLAWQCTDGHIWYATPRNIKRGRWCPECAIKQRIFTRTLRKIAKQVNK